MPPAPFSACFVQYESSAVVMHMQKALSYERMVENLRRWCGREYMASLGTWDVVSAPNLAGMQALNGGQASQNAVRPSVAGRCSVQASALVSLDHALLIKAEWCQEIFEHGKCWEIRGQCSKIRGRIAIAQCGTGTLVGEATLVDCIVVGKYSEEDRCLMPYSSDEADVQRFLGRPENLSKHRIQDLSIVTYAVVYAWVSEEPRRNAAPIAFVHRCGAMMWIDFKWIRALPRDQVL